MATTAREILLEAADLIEQPGRWTQGAQARNAEGNSRNFSDADATCFCMFGAMLRVSGIKHGLSEADWAWPAWVAVGELFGDDNPGEDDEDGQPSPSVVYNDTPGRTAAQVAAKLRAAAETI